MTKMLKLIAFISPLLFIHLGQARDKSSGCGLGWKVSKRMSITSSSVRLSTNSFTTPLGITSGTSGCKRHSIVQNKFKQIHFVEENMDQLEVEMSIGQGQTVEQLAALVGCENKVNVFTKTMQKNYNDLFQGPKTIPLNLLNMVKDKIVKSSELSAGCHLI
ncbi:MAG: hypothetical protein CME68_01995 [Halobacteriovoraceae bacterium]|nr:hypothetical protein [Halobacteriovoraceae bacterium]